MKFDPSGPWFLGADHEGNPIKGYTNDPDQAWKPNGFPVVSTGWAKRVQAVDYEKRAQLWEHLLDMMEELYGLQDESEIKIQEAVIRGIVDALAILEYGWTFQHEPDNARGMISRQSVVRYNMSVAEDEG